MFKSPYILMRAARVASDFQGQYPDQFPANTRYTRARIKAPNIMDNDIFAKTLKLTPLADLLRQLGSSLL